MNKKLHKIITETLKQYYPKTTDDGGDRVAFTIIKNIEKAGYEIIEDDILDFTVKKYKN